jgi:dihydrofolate synthase / folylpolyglutamate synthase
VASLDPDGGVSLDDQLWALARPSPRGARPTLERMHRLLRLFDNPHERLPAAHVGGTSGKGSTCHLLAAIFQAAGYPVGLHSKPHLATVRERLLLDGLPITPGDFGALLQDASPRLQAADWPEGRPTWFELVVALAFTWFAARQARPVVVEVGLGGSWDATNVLQPLVSVLTNVGLDHMELLGDTVEAIARDKAGIIKPGAVAITGATQPTVLAIIAARAAQAGVPLWRLGQEIRVDIHRVDGDGARFDLHLPGLTYRDLAIGLLGRHQVDNAALAVAAAAVLAERGYPVDEGTLRRGLAACRIPGRLERFAGRPQILLDGAHNPEKMAALAAALRLLYPGRRPVCVVAMRRGHDIATTLAPLLTVASTVILTQISAGTDWGREQSVDPILLRRTIAVPPGVTVLIEPEAEAALQLARNEAGPEGLVCVTGSLYLVGQLRGRLPNVGPFPGTPLAEITGWGRGPHASGR